MVGGKLDSPELELDDVGVVSARFVDVAPNPNKLEGAALLEVNGTAAATGIGGPKCNVSGAMLGCKIVVVLVGTGACPPEGCGVGVKLPKGKGAAAVVVGRIGMENVGLGWSPTAVKVEAEVTLLLADEADTGGYPVCETSAASGFFPMKLNRPPVGISVGG